MIATPRQIEIVRRPFTMDDMCVREVIQENCYHLPARFSPADSIVDVGAHIGCFSLACLMRGAGKILAFEPDKENFALLEKNLAGKIGVRAYNAAVWGSDMPLTFSGYPGGNTACGTCLPDVAVAGKNDALPVKTTTLDRILEEMKPQRRLHLLKLDCEGGEYPILYTSKRLGQIDQIIGEVHEAPWLKDSGLVEGFTDYDMDEVAWHLERNGFVVTLEQHGAQWLFWARNTHRR